MSVSTNGREPLYVVRTSNIHGRGVFANRYIRKGTRILEYTGERIDNDEADRRYDDAKMKRHHTFLFTLDKDTCIDGAIATGGGDASFINHSCDPNCETDELEGRVWIIALRDIEAGEELTYDYNLYDGEDDDKSPCSCGAKNCRGTLFSEEELERRGKAASQMSSGTPVSSD
jgi:uncharacterized protein